jgi:hypothetical protein
MKPDDYIMDKVMPEPNTGCWLWTASLGTGGYGSGWVPSLKRHMVAHRAVYRLFHEDVPKHLTLDHKCRVRWCVNPTHLEAVPFAENIRRGSLASQIDCKRGHPLSGDNIYVSRTGARQCKQCMKITYDLRRQKRGEG